MPLPTITTTWLYRVNRSMARDTDLEHRQYMLLELVNSILGLGTGWTDADNISVTPTSPWEVYSSSDGVAADATNRWAAVGDLVWAAEGVAHSWIVLTNPNYFGAGVPLYILINCSQGGAHRNATLGVYFSGGPFEEGSTTTRPTATDEAEVLPSDGSMTTAPWQGTDDSDEDHRTGRLHFWLSDDGSHFRAIICRGGVDVSWWDLFPCPDYDILLWSTPAVMSVRSHDADTAVLTWTSVVDSALYATFDNPNVNSTFSLEASMTYFGDTAIVDLDTNICTGESGWDSIMLAGMSPAGGLFTAIPDARWGLSSEPNAAFGDSRTWQQFTNVVVPWNTTICIKS